MIASGAAASAAKTDEDGRATLQVGAGEVTLHAEKDGLVRSFTETVTSRDASGSARRASRPARVTAMARLRRRLRASPRAAAPSCA